MQGERNGRTKERFHQVTFTRRQRPLPGYRRLAAALASGVRWRPGGAISLLKKRNVIGGQELRVSGDRSALSTMAPPKRRPPRRDQAADPHVGRWKRRHVGGVG